MRVRRARIFHWRKRCQPGQWRVSGSERAAARVRRPARISNAESEEGARRACARRRVPMSSRGARQNPDSVVGGDVVGVVDDAIDTIAAISTPPGEGGIGIVRMSGPRAFDVAGHVFREPSGRRPRRLRPWGIRYGVVVDPGTGEVIDEALAACMPAPHSFTREDVVELSCHGGVAVLHRVLEAVRSAGARLAEPGEFTRRAFLSGRIDLAQAEAVVEIIRAKSDSARRLALANLRGSLSERVCAVREDMVKVLAEIEASVDFPEDDAGDLDLMRAAGDIEAGSRRLKELAASARSGRVYRDGVKVVIAGRPNVGKSSILNALVGRSRAIVTDVPGTTRDAVRDWTNICGLPVELVDTAGLRDSVDPVERLGVEGAEREMAEADVVLAVMDASGALSPDDEALLARLGGREGIVVLNKCDLGAQVDEALVSGHAAGKRVVRISALKGTGIAELERAIFHVCSGRVTGASDGPTMATARQQEALESAASALNAAALALSEGSPVDLAAIDLREALFWLDQITGRSASDEILDAIFSEFCVGK